MDDITFKKTVNPRPEGTERYTTEAVDAILDRQPEINPDGGHEFGNHTAQELGRRSVRGVVVSFGAQVVRFLVQFGSQILLARLLIPADFGLVAMGIPVLTLAQTIGELGLAQAVIQRPTLTHEDASQLFWFSVMINLSLALLMALTAPLIAHAYGEPRLALVIVMLAAMLPFNGIASQQMAYMARHMRFSKMAAIDVACLVTANAAGVGGALAGLGYWSLVMMQVSNMMVIAIGATLLSGWRPSRPTRARGIGAMLTFGAHLTGTNLVNYAAGNLDSVLIGALLGPVSLGFYDRSMKLIVAPINQLTMPLARVATGLLSRLQFAPENYRRAYLAMLQGLLVAIAPGFCCAALTAGRWVPALLGPQWTAAAPVVSWLCMSAILIPFGISSGWLFISQARVESQLKWACVRTGLTLTALGVGLPWGVTGVAIAYALFSPFIHGSGLWGSTRYGPVNLGHVIAGTYPILLCTAVGVAVAGLALRWMPLHGAFPVLIESVVVTYAAGAATLLCFPAGVALLRDIVKVWQSR
jgi:PST family polysaccharide transporter